MSPNQQEVLIEVDTIFGKIRLRKDEFEEKGFVPSIEFLWNVEFLRCEVDLDLFSFGLVNPMVLLLLVFVHKRFTNILPEVPDKTLDHLLVSLDL